MEIFKNIEQCRLGIRKARQSGDQIGFVPTMGYLHAGHLELVKAAKLQSDFVVVSIFVNPTQFNDPKDLKAYPIDIDGDLEKLRSVGVSAVFIPQASDIYPQGAETSISVRELSRRYEGAFRPGHFEGVATVVSLLFNIVAPDLAAFGEKDFQQLQIVQRLVNDLHHPVRILSVPIVREPDGLAMSSRNVRLKGEERTRAASLYRALMRVNQLFLDGVTDPSVLSSEGKKLLTAEGIEVEYLELVHSSTLVPAQKAEKGQRALAAVRIGSVRLIDNLEIGIP